MKDVYEEVDNLMGRLGVDMHKIKPCTRKYAFELPGIPKEAEYLKLLYPYTSELLPSNSQVSVALTSFRKPSTYGY